MNAGATIRRTAFAVAITAASTTLACRDPSTGVPDPIAALTLLPASGFAPTGVGVPLAVTALDAHGDVLTDSRPVAWTTSDRAIVIVSATGVLTGVSIGTATITASRGGTSASAVFTVRTGLKHAVPITFSNATSGGAATEFALFVPPATTALRVTLSGGTGDPDLYLYRPGNVEVDSEDCSSFTDGPNETCVLPNPAPGVWWVRVDPFIAHTGTTILATLAPAPM